MDYKILLTVILELGDNFKIISPYNLDGTRLGETLDCYEEELTKIVRDEIKNEIIKVRLSCL